jgi:hypothetical protein
MKVAAADIPALIAFGASGGFAGIFVALGFAFPKHQDAWNGAAAATVALCTTIAGVLRILSVPAPPSGAVSANIPKGTIPVVGFPTAEGGQQVAVVGPATVATNTVHPVSANVKP